MIIVTNAQLALSILRSEEATSHERRLAFTYLDSAGAFADIDAQKPGKQTLADEIKAFDGPDAPETDYATAASIFRLRTDLSTLADARDIHRLDLEVAIDGARVKCGRSTEHGPCTRVKGHHVVVNGRLAGPGNWCRA